MYAPTLPTFLSAHRAPASERRSWFRLGALSSTVTETEATSLREGHAAMQVVIDETRRDLEESQRRHRALAAHVDTYAATTASIEEGARLNAAATQAVHDRVIANVEATNALGEQLRTLTRTVAESNVAGLQEGQRVMHEQLQGLSTKLAGFFDKLDDTEAEAAAARDAAAAALRHAAAPARPSWPGTPGAATARRDTMLVADPWQSPSSSYDRRDTLLGHGEGPASGSGMMPLPPRHPHPAAALGTPRTGLRILPRGAPDEPPSRVEVEDIVDDAPHDLARMGWRPHAGGGGGRGGQLHPSTLPPPRPSFGRGAPAGGATSRPWDAFPVDYHGRMPPTRSTLPYPPLRDEDDDPHHRLRTHGVGRAWLPEGSVKAFTGIFVVGSRCTSTDPLLWAQAVATAMRSRRIPEDLWTESCVTCLDQKVLDDFIACQVGSTPAALAAHICGACPGDGNPLAATSWDDFRHWMMRTYITDDKIEALDLDVNGMKCRDLAGVRQFITDFNRAAMSADFVKCVLQYGCSQHEVPDQLRVMLDTPLRRVAFRGAMPPEVQQMYLMTESQQRAGNRHWHFGLQSLQDAAAAHADAVAGSALRKERPLAVSVNHMHADPASPPVDPSAEVKAEILLLKSMQADLDAKFEALQPGASSDDDGEELYLRLDELVDSPPPQKLIDERRSAKQCLWCGCGDLDDHFRFQDCPKLRSDPAIAAKIDSLLAAQPPRGRRSTAKAGTRRARP